MWPRQEVLVSVSVFTFGTVAFSPTASRTDPGFRFPTGTREKSRTIRAVSCTFTGILQVIWLLSDLMRIIMTMIIIITIIILYRSGFLSL